MSCVFLSFLAKGWLLWESLRWEKAQLAPALSSDLEKAAVFHWEGTCASLSVELVLRTTELTRQLSGPESKESLRDLGG